MRVQVLLEKLPEVNAVRAGIYHLCSNYCKDAMCKYSGSSLSKNVIIE